MGFDILLRRASLTKHGAFVFTSNVDGHFQKARFPPARVAECHGTIHQLQCVEACTDEVWSAADVNPVVNEKTCLLKNELPRCPRCGALARPNILMFGDWNWVDKYAERQELALAAWLESVEKPVVVELGAGRAIPTIRRFSERQRCPVIRINPRDYSISPAVGVGIAGGALETLQQLDNTLSEVT
nr:Sir2 family NAD-dependent protein deacetylase [Paraburkholderia podalyriae]